jgi:mRNA interferase HigB
MRVISKKKVRVFWLEHPEAEESLRAWYRVVSKADWENFGDLREAFPGADKVGDCTVFNISGNKFRLVALIFFKTRRVYVRQVLTHKQYEYPFTG